MQYSYLKYTAVFVALMALGSIESQAQTMQYTHGISYPTYTGNSIEHGSNTGASAPIPPYSQQNYRVREEDMVNTIRLNIPPPVIQNDPYTGLRVVPRERPVNYFNGDKGVPIYRTVP